MPEMIAALMQIARKAEALESAAGLACARATIVEVVRLMGLQAPPKEAPLAARPAPELPPLLTVEQWTRKWCTPGLEGIPQPLDDE
jgi:hypothetical protein